MKVAFDFETEGIQPFPDYPPRPVGLALYKEGQAPCYYAWGHPAENNCAEEFAKAELAALWNDPDVELVAHNLAFDLAVAAKHWGLSLFPACTLHDTMVQAFLLDPHATTYALKPSAEKHLGLPPEEQDEVRDWLVANGVAKSNAKDWGASISKAPAELVGRYAIGDVVRTLRLFTEHYTPQITQAQMDVAYRREMQLMPIMLENTLAGIVVDVVRLTNDVSLYETALTEIETLLFKELGAEPFNVDSDAELADHIDKAYPGLQWTLTKTGKRSTSKANIEKTLAGVGGKLGAILQYRASISTCLNTFMKPWLLQATKGDGRIRCQWNTTRGDKVGARTGRLSSNPNFMNIPTLESAKFKQAIKLRAEFLPNFPPLPNVRCYILADTPDHVLLDRDFGGQELRVMAHFEDGAALQAYKDDPHLDLHQWAADYINANLGLGISRKQTKTCIAKDSEVLTNCGLVPIQDITSLHLIWDGVEYVRHTGLLCKGTQPVYKYRGLTATLDHEVYTDDFGKIEFGTAIAKRASITSSGRGGQALRTMESGFAGSLAEKRKAGRPSTHSLTGGVHKVRHAGMGAVRQFNRRLLNKMPQLLHHQVAALQGLGAKILGNKAEVRNATLPGVQMVRRAGHTVSLQNMRRFCSVCGDYFTLQVVPGATHRPYQQQRALPTGESAVSNQYGKRQEQTYQRVHPIQWAGSAADAFMAPVKNRLAEYAAWARAHCQAVVKWGVVGGYRVASAAQGRAEVFDISNAGPRHRFTVSDKLVSNCSFAILYGSGLATLAEQMGGTVEEAANVKAAYLNALPGLQGLIDGLKRRARNNQPFRTWGGRVYYCEPAKFMEGRWRTFSYKMVNYLIQGSSADISKEALIRYHAAKRRGRIVLMVHDEICISCPKEHWREEMQILKQCMETIELDAKLVSDGDVGYNWHELTPENEYANH